MSNPEAKNGRIQPVETRLSRGEFSTQQLKDVIQRSIDESQSDPTEIEIVGDEQSLHISHSVFRLVNALPPRHKETRNRFFKLVIDPALENADYMIIREA